MGLEKPTAKLDDDGKSIDVSADITIAKASGNDYGFKWISSKTRLDLDEAKTQAIAKTGIKGTGAATKMTGTINDKNESKFDAGTWFYIVAYATDDASGQTVYTDAYEYVYYTDAQLLDKYGLKVEDAKTTVANKAAFKVSYTATELAGVTVDYIGFLFNREGVTESYNTTARVANINDADTNLKISAATKDYYGGKKGTSTTLSATVANAKSGSAVYGRGYLELTINNAVRYIYCGSIAVNAN